MSLKRNAASRLFAMYALAILNLTDQLSRASSQ